ncbi:MAG: hypothetical protein JWN15_3832 [Firmicutes bacterium]|nr:hypothetical protein [Bacillota bacterium]
MRPNVKRLRLVLVRVLVLMLFVASLGGTRAYGETNTKDVIIGLPGDIKNFNIAMGFNPSWFPSTMYFSRLVTMDYGPDFAIRPDLATDWQVSDDGLTYTFHLHKNVKWHDGKPFTSDDVKYTFEATVQNKGMALDIFSHVKSIDTPDPDTVVIHLKETFAPFLVQLAMYPRTPILPKHLYEGTDWATNPYNMKPVGTGPYKFEKSVPGQYFSFVRNDDYFGKKPAVERVILKVLPDVNVAVAQLRSGEIQALNDPPPLQLEKSLAADPNITVDEHPGPMVYFLSFNVTKPPYNNTAVRTALAYAINREDLNQKVTQGIYKTATGTYEPSVKWAFNDQARLPDYDPKKANAMLDAAGFPVKDGTRFGLDLWISRATELNAAQVIKEQLKQVGVDVKITQLEDGLLRKELKSRKQDAYLYGNWWGPDPSEWEQYTASTGTWNETGYANPRVDELFKLGLKTVDQNQRATYYKEIQEIVLKDMPRIPLFGSGPYSFAHRKDLEGWFSQQPVSYRMDMTGVHWVTQAAAPGASQPPTATTNDASPDGTAGTRSPVMWVVGLAAVAGILLFLRRGRGGKAS